MRDIQVDCPPASSMVVSLIGDIEAGLRMWNSREVAAEAPTVEEVIADTAAAAFGRPLVTNVLRGHLVEAIVARALGSRWHWCGGDYHPWDFHRDDGVRLEVKQSAARQSWATPTAKPSAATFDIAARRGHRDDDGVMAEKRAAQLYIFAYHPVTDASADHRDVETWIFHVIPERHLPAQKQLSISRVQALGPGCRFGELREAVTHIADLLVAERPAGIEIL